MAKPDPAAYQDHLWAAYCAREELLGGLGDDIEDQGDDFDGDRVPLPSPEPDRAPPTAELAAVLADFADRKRRGREILRGLETGDTNLIRLVHPSVLADPARRAALKAAAVELAGRLRTPPAEPERPFQPPVHWPDHPLAGHQAPEGYVSHGIQFEGEQRTPLERLTHAFRQKAALLARFRGLEGMQGNIAGAMAPAFNARLRELEDQIDSLGRLMNLDPVHLHDMDLEAERQARRALAEQQRIREQAGRPGPPRITAGWPTDYLGRPRPEQAPKEHPEQGWTVPGSQPAARPHRGRQRRRGRPAFRKSAILARQAR